MDTRHDARNVEIALALVLGVIVAVVPPVGMWATGHVWQLTDAGWTAARHVVGRVAVVVGASVSVLWLVHARRRGL